MSPVGQCSLECVPEEGEHESGYHTLAYVIKAGAHAHKGALRDSDKSRAQIIPCPAARRPILGALSPSEVHLHKPRGAQGHKGRWELKLWTWRKGHPVWAPPWVPGGPQPCVQV